MIRLISQIRQSFRRKQGPVVQMLHFPGGYSGFMFDLSRVDYEPNYARKEGRTALLPGQVKGNCHLELQTKDMHLTECFPAWKI